MLTVLGGQAAYLLPWTFGGLIIAPARSLGIGKRGSPGMLMLYLSLPIILILTLLPLFGAWGLPRWEMPGWLFLFPPLGCWISEFESDHKRLHRNTLGLSVASMCILGSLLASQSQFGWMKHVLPEGQKRLDPTQELVEWKGLRESLRRSGFL